jgi:AraC family transcriptional regulator
MIFDDGFLEEKGHLTHMIGFATTHENRFDDLEQNLFRMVAFFRL